MTAATWLVLTWRLPSTSSTPRVATWRSLQRLGAVTLTPGAAVVRYSEDMLEQLEWVAEDIVQRGGEAYVLPVTELREADEAEIRRRMRAALKRGMARPAARDHLRQSARRKES